MRTQPRVLICLKQLGKLLQEEIDSIWVVIFKIESYFKAIELTTGTVKRAFLSSLISFLSLLRSRPVKKTIGFSFVRLMQEEKNPSSLHRGPGKEGRPKSRCSIS